MSGWTEWREIARGGEWFDDLLDWDGPACYELGIAGPRGGDLRIVCVGETVNEKKRVAAYARSGSHLAGIIASHLRQGWSLCYRAQAAPSKQAAKRMQDSPLARHEYDWNILLNPRFLVDHGRAGGAAVAVSLGGIARVD
jgi:hypothetical protein